VIGSCDVAAEGLAKVNMRQVFRPIRFVFFSWELPSVWECPSPVSSYVPRRYE